MPERPLEFSLPAEDLARAPLPDLLRELGVCVPAPLRVLAGRVKRATADRLGVLARRLERRAGSVAILMYHKVQHRSRDDWGEPVLDAPMFAEHCRFLADHANVVPLHEVASALAAGAPLPPRAVAISFDDGFRSTAELALPILARHRLPAAVFVVTALCETDRWLWPFEVEAMVRVHGAARVCGESGDPVGERLGRENLPLRWAALALVERFKRLPPAPLAERLERLRAVTPVELDPDNRFLSWAEVRELAAAGVEVGSHTATHAILPTLQGAEVEREVAGARAALAAQLGQPPRYFCYPNGNLSPASREVVRRHHAAALGTQPGENLPGADLFALKRICAPVEVRDLAFALAFPADG